METKPAFAAMLYRVSTANVTGWPFLCVSIGFTKVRRTTTRFWCLVAEKKKQITGSYWGIKNVPRWCLAHFTAQEAVGILRQGACFTECNRRRTVMEVVHELHQAQFHAFLVLCRNEPATHHALHLSEVSKWSPALEFLRDWYLTE